MREYNRAVVLNFIRSDANATRASLAKKTGMSSTSIGRIVGNLIDDGLVMETGAGQNKLGRKATVLQLNPGGYHAVGVDIDVTEVNIGLVDLNGTVAAHASIAVDGEWNRKTLERVAAATHAFVKKLAPAQRDRLGGIGIGMPGHVRRDDGRAILSPQLKLRDVNLTEIFAKGTALPVLVDNDVKADAFAEKLFGIALDQSDFAVVNLGNGFGVSIFQNDKLVRGRDNLFGELGHIIVEPGGYPCDCGKRGCLQTLLCLSSLERRERKPFRTILERGRGGRNAASAVLDRVRDAATVWTANLVEIYNTPLVIMTGKMIDLWTELPELVRNGVDKHLWPHLRGGLRVIGMGETGGDLVKANRYIQAAASIVFYELFYGRI